MCIDASSFFLKVLLLSVFMPTITAAAPKERGGVVSQPVIYGDLDGVSVISQGDKAVYYISPDQILAEAHQTHDENSLFGAMAKNHTSTILLSPESIRFLQSGQKELDEPESSCCLPSSRQQAAQTRTEISLPIQITPTATYTGIPVIDQTPALAWLNRETMLVLAESMKAHETYEITTSAYYSERELISVEPTTTDEAYQQLLRMTGTADEHSSIIQLFTPTPHVRKQYWKGYEIGSGQDIFRLEPHPSSPIPTADSHTYSWKIRQAGTTDTTEAVDTSQPTDSPSTTEQAMVSSITGGASPSATPVLSASQATSAGNAPKEKTIYFMLKSSIYGIGFLTDHAKEELKKRDNNIDLSSYESSHWDHVLRSPEDHQLLARLIKEYQDLDQLNKLFRADDVWEKRSDWRTGIEVIEVPEKAYHKGYCRVIEDYEGTEQLPRNWRLLYQKYLKKQSLKKKCLEMESSLDKLRLFTAEFKTFIFTASMKSDEKINLLQKLFPPIEDISPDKVEDISPDKVEDISPDKMAQNFLCLIGREYQCAKSDSDENQAE